MIFKAQVTLSGVLKHIENIVCGEEAFHHGVLTGSKIESEVAEKTSFSARFRWPVGCFGPSLLTSFQPHSARFSVAGLLVL